MDKKENKKLLFGLIFTLIMYLIVDNMTSKLNIYGRIILVLILLFIGYLIFRWMFIREED